MKIIIAIVMLISLLNADIEIQQNIRALYKGVTVSDEQREYLLDNHDENIELLKKLLKQEIKKSKLKHISEKNVITFNLKTNGNINKIKFLKRSGNNKVDKLTKRVIKNIGNKLVKPNSDIEMRFIISFRVGVKPTVQNNINYQSREEYIMPISKGTTRFQHDSKEYVRTFTTSRDGFINVTALTACATVKLLTNDNQKVNTGYTFWTFNKEIMKGTYKLLIKTKKTCDVSLQYL